MRPSLAGSVSRVFLVCGGLQFPTLFKPEAPHVARMIYRDEGPQQPLTCVSREMRLSDESLDEMERIQEADEGTIDLEDLFGEGAFWDQSSALRHFLEPLALLKPLFADRGSYGQAAALRAQAIRTRKRRQLAPFAVRRRRARNQTRPPHHR